MQNSKWSSSATIELFVASRTANCSDGDLKLAQSLSLSHPKDRVAPDHWQLGGRNLFLEVGSDRLGELLAAVEDIAEGNGDYSIGLESCPLWVWWWVEGAENGI